MGLDHGAWPCKTINNVPENALHGTFKKKTAIQSNKLCWNQLDFRGLRSAYLSQADATKHIQNWLGVRVLAVGAFRCIFIQYPHLFLLRGEEKKKIIIPTLAICCQGFVDRKKIKKRFKWKAWIFYSRRNHAILEVGGTVQHGRLLRGEQ